MYTLIDISSDIVDTDDKVYNNYARILCHYGAMFMEPGQRVMVPVFRYWKLMLPHFKANERTKCILALFFPMLAQ